MAEYKFATVAELKSGFDWPLLGVAKGGASLERLIFPPSHLASDGLN